MPYLTRGQAVALSRSRTTTRLAATELRESARSAPLDRTFHVFLSHSFSDAEVILGVKLRLEQDGLTVYVDWIDDPLLDRTAVTEDTARLLRRRMDQCRFLLYACSRTSVDSRWMPWELGYFDGRRRGKVGIFPIVETASETFVGVEYLGLYPEYKLIDFEYVGRQIATMTGPSQAQTLRTAAGL
jgi:hypothetical protein